VRDAALLHEVIEVFLADTPKQMAALDSAVARRDATAIASAAHALKGSCGLFSTAGAYESAQRLEKLAREGVLDGIDAAVEAANRVIWEDRPVSIRMWKRIGAMLVALVTFSPVGAQTLQKLVFATDWLAQAEHGGFYQAVAEGTYRKHGLDVQIRMGGPQVNGLQLLAAGQIDIAMADALQVLSAIEQNVPVVAFAATFQKNPTVLISHPGVNRLEVDRAVPHQEGLESEEAREVAKRTYSHGVAVTKEVITGIRLGRATSVKRVKRAVQLIVDQVLNNETSLMGLTTLRDYDEYTFTHSVNVCIFAVALGKKLGFSKLQLYDLGMTALLHDVGKARIPIDILNKTSGLDEKEWQVVQAHPWLGALTLFGLRGYDEIPYRSILVAYEHHMKTDLTGYPRSLRPRALGIFSRIVAVADGFDAATTRRSYQTVPIEPDQVLREMWENPKRGYDRVLVKALINLIGVYPVGTCVILDTFEIGIVAATNPDGQQLNRPLVRIAVNTDGAVVPPPGELVSLTEQDETGSFRRSIVKVTTPSRYGLTVGDYFV